MNLPLTSVTGLAFESGHTGRSEKRGVPFFIDGGVLPSFLQSPANYCQVLISKNGSGTFGRTSQG